MEQQRNSENKDVIGILEKLEVDYRDMKAALDEYSLLLDSLNGAINYNRKLKTELIEQMGAEEAE